MSLLQSLLANSGRPAQNFVLLQSSLSQSSLPILCSLAAKSKGQLLLICLLYPSKIFPRDHDQSHIHVLDCRDHVPSYSDDGSKHQQRVSSALEHLDASLPLTVVVDSLDTLFSNTSDSVSETYRFLSSLLTAVQAHKGASRLLVHGVGSSSLTALLSQPSFSATFTHLIAHPPALLKHITSQYSTPPPPLTAPERFWGVFTPIAEREHESETLVFGTDGDGYGGDEIVVELVVRSTGGARRRGVDRVLEGWVVEGDHAGPCELTRLASLSGVWDRKVAAPEKNPDPTQNVSFNLNLTPAQQQSRAQVPLPYAHDGVSKHEDTEAGIVPQGSILYDPDSADDIDDDDPDEDLDI